jgi:Tol biopolymer transport system component
MIRVPKILVFSVLVPPALAQTTTLISVASNGVQGNDASYQSAISPDGRYVAFASPANNLVPGDVGFVADVFVRDRQAGTTDRVSMSSTGIAGNGDSSFPSISATGRYVAFMSYASNLVPSDTNGALDVFVRDRQNQTTQRVSVDSGGTQGNDISLYPSISADGRYVAFMSHATNLVPGDTNGVADVFVRDLQSGITERISVDSLGLQGDGESLLTSTAACSADGRYVVFHSSATNLVPVDTCIWADVFVRDRQAGTTELVSVDSIGAQGNAGSGPGAISADGRYVAFQSGSGLVPADTNFHQDVYVRDRQSGTTERVSVSTAGAQGNGDTVGWPSISADGTCVVFASNSDNLFPTDTNGSVSDFLLRDRLAGTTERVSLSWSGAQASLYSWTASVSSDGRSVAFSSDGNNLVPVDTNSGRDVFVRDRFGGTSFTSQCTPGAGGVIPCPCANPPAGTNRGCDNSAATGGAILLASGATVLSSDSLVFTTSGEKPTATSVVLQGTSTFPSGSIYGQGVRCVGVVLKRLFTKSAVAGSIAAPDFGAGDPTVSARSAAKGDTIQPGQSRWYLVYYRDPTVLGGCPATNTFNSTQTGAVSWSP